MTIETVAHPVVWALFTLFVLAMLALDLGVFHRRAHAVGSKEALAWTIVWIALALGFAAGLYLRVGSEPALEFLTGYVVEKALSIDNMFVILIVFQSFAVPAALQHTVLVWGIVGALAMRAVLIVVGGTLLHTLHWLIYAFGAFLVFTGIRLFLHDGYEIRPEAHPLVRLFRRLVPVVPDHRGARFFVTERGRRHATPLLLALVAVEATDLMFALDSIPAIFALTPDPFIVYTSNVFAMLGLRSLYFLLAGAMGRFHLLQKGLALVLVFVGVKLALADVYAVPIGVALGVVAALIGGAIGLSLVYPKAGMEPAPKAGAGPDVSAPPRARASGC
jgi:tellurite resistance protein TerC